MPFLVFDASDADAELREETRRIIVEVANTLVNELKEEAPVGATGDLRRSFQVFRVSEDVVWLGSRLGYAQFVNDGTAPHTPPFEPIQRWARRKLGDADAAGAVWQKIRQEGTDPNPYLDRAMENTLQQFQ
jgi:hypothetical protein